MCFTEKVQKLFGTHQESCLKSKYIKINVPLNCTFYFLPVYCVSKICLHVSCVFVPNVLLCVCTFSSSSASNIERNDTLWSRTWIAHWFLRASLTIHSNWFLALLGVRVMAVLMYHLYVYSSPPARGFTIVCGKCICCSIGTWRQCLYLVCSVLLYISRRGTHKTSCILYVVGGGGHLLPCLFQPSLFSSPERIEK